MKIEELSTGSLKFYKYNNKTHPPEQVEKISRSIEEFGFRNPVLIDGDEVIIAGHGRVLAAKKLGLLTVPCVRVTDLTADQVKAFRIMDNKSAESEFDFDNLRCDFEDLKASGFDLELTGFNLDEVNELLADGNEEMVAVDVEADDVNDVKTGILEGDLFQIGNHRLMCGDSTSEESVSKLLNNDTPILMVTDPPYGVNYNPSWRDEADKAGILGNKYPTRSLGKVANDDRADWTEAWQLFPGDVAYVYHAGLFSGTVGNSLEKANFQLKSQLIWAKPHFALSRGDYHWKHEPIWYAVKKGRKHNWQGSRKEHTVWEIAGMNAMGASHKESDEATGHGTQKPVECMARPVRNSSEEGESVYDPFGGSGSTMIACEQLKRSCYMMELDPKYCQVIINRIIKLNPEISIQCLNRQHDPLNEIIQGTI